MFPAMIICGGKPGYDFQYIFYRAAKAARLACTDSPYRLFCYSATMPRVACTACLCSIFVVLQDGVKAAWSGVFVMLQGRLAGSREGIFVMVFLLWCKVAWEEAGTGIFIILQGSPTGGRDSFLPCAPYLFYPANCLGAGRRGPASSWRLGLRNSCRLPALFQL